jgi:hypothetical protein
LLLIAITDGEWHSDVAILTLTDMLISRFKRSGKIESIVKGNRSKGTGDEMHAKEPRSHDELSIEIETVRSNAIE